MLTAIQERRLFRNGDHCTALTPSQKRLLKIASQRRGRINYGEVVRAKCSNLKFEELLTYGFIAASGKQMEPWELTDKGKKLATRF